MLFYLQRIAKQLPFHLEDVDAANALFVRWHAERKPEDKKLVDIWTYCFIYRYFLMKFVEGDKGVAMDPLITRTFGAIHRGQEAVQQPDRYASWVSKLCKHAFINYLRIDRYYEAMGEDFQALPAPPAGPYDVSMIRHSLHEAIASLPLFLRDIATMRLVDNLSYDEMQEATGKELPILRSYTNKAMRHLRNNGGLHRLYKELYS